MKVIFKFLVAVISFSALSACGMTSENGANTAQIQTETTKPIMVGGDRDAHNCIPSAGYTWSQTRNQCVRIWEVGTKLYDPNIANPTSYDLVILNGENDPIELFLALKSSNIPIILNKIGENWRDSNGNFTISKSANGNIILQDKDGKILSQSR